MLRDSNYNPPWTSSSKPDLLESSDAGVSVADDLTSDSTPTFSGTAEAGSIVELFANDQSLGTTKTDEEGKWQFTVPVQLALNDGSYGITASDAVLPTSFQNRPIPVASPGRSAKEWKNSSAFAVLKDDGSVITWGNSSYGGDSSSVSAQLSSGVEQIFSNKQAFAALKQDGSVITWGDSRYGGDSSSVKANLGSRVAQIFSTGYAFAALKDSGSVITWGSAYGGYSDNIQLGLDVSHIFSSESAFAALKDDGSVVTWGNPSEGGDSSSVSFQLSSGVSQIFSSSRSLSRIDQRPTSPQTPLNLPRSQ